MSGLALTEAELARVAAVDEEVARGPAGVGGLLAGLSDPSWTVRRAVVAGLAALGDDAAPALAAWLRDARTSEHAIAAAVDALSAATGAAATEAALALLDDPRPAIAADAAAILGRRRAAEATAALAAQLEHADDNVAVASIEALGAIGGPAALDALIAVVRRRSFFRTFPAVQVLARLDDPRAIAPLVELLDDPLFQVDAARALGRAGSPLAVAPLAGLLAQPGPDPVRLVAGALAEALPRAAWSGAEPAVIAAMRATLAPHRERFAAALTGAELPDQLALVRVLGALGGPAALTALIAQLDEPNLRDAATAAIRALVAAEPDALASALAGGDPDALLALVPLVHSPAAAPALRALLADDDAELRARACEALARVGDRDAVPALFDALRDPSPRVQHAATAAIHALGSEATPPLALHALRTGTAAVRRQALRIVGYLGWPEAFAAVRAAIDDADPRVAEIAVGALAAFDGVDPLLAELAERPAEGLRAAAVRVAAQRTGPAMAALLGRGLADRSPWVRYYACQGLGRLGDPAAISALIARLTDDHAHVRIAAIEALSRFDVPAARQALIAAVHARDPDEQRAALLGLAGDRQPGTLALLLEAAAHDDAATQLIALAGLGRRDEPAALAALAAAATGARADLRDAALSLLGERTDRAAAASLVEAALATDADHPAHAALSRPGGARVEALAARLDDADDRAAPVLAAALARMAAPAAVATLFAALAARSPAARRAAAASVLAIEAEGARRAVARLATDDPDPAVRRACRAALDARS